MKAKTRRTLFWATIACGVILPWLTILVSALVFEMPLDAAFRPLSAVLPLFPVAVALLAAWWTIPFVVFAFLWYRLATGEWEPLRRNPLLVLLGIPVALLPMGASESPIAALYLLGFLVYAMVTVPSWGLKSPIGRLVFGLFGLFTILALTVLQYGFFIGLGPEQVRQHIAAPFGILAYMTDALLVGYLFAKPVDLLVTRGEPLLEISDRPRPSGWLIGGNALACGLSFNGILLLLSRSGGSAVTRHEIGQSLADQPIMLPISAMTVGVVLGLGIYFLSFVMLHKGRYRRDDPLLFVVLAILPGFLTGIAPGLLGERAIMSILGSNYLRMYSGFGSGSIDNIAISPDGSRIVADAGWRVVIWDVGSGNPVVDVLSESTEVWSTGEALAWSPDGSRVSVSAPGGQIAVLDSHSGRWLRTFDPPDPQRPENVFAGTVFSPDGTRLIAARSDGSIHTYELASGKLERTWQSPVPTRDLLAIALSPEGRRLAVAGVSDSKANPMGGFVAVLDVNTGENLYSIDDLEQTASQVSFSPDGSLLLLAGTNNPPRLLDASAGRPLLEIHHHCPPPSAPYVSSLFYAAFLEGGRSLAVACNNGVVEVCDSSSGDCRVLFELQLKTVSGIAAHPNGRHIAVVEEHKAVTLWDSRTTEPWLSYRMP